MIPTEEEKQRIQEAQLMNPDVPLGSAEQFLLTLSSITELSARLQLWAFKMDYELIEKVRYIPAPTNQGQMKEALRLLHKKRFRDFFCIFFQAFCLTIYIFVILKSLSSSFQDREQK